MKLINNLSLKNKFLLPVLLAFIMLSGIIYYANNSLNEVSSGFNKFIDNDLTIINNLSELYAQGLQSEQATRNILINPLDKKAKSNYNKSDEDFVAALTILKQIESIDNDFKNKLLEIENQWKELDKHKRKVQDLATTSFQQGSEYLIKTETPKWREFKDNILTTLKSKKDEVVVTNSEMNERVDSSAFNLIISGVIALALLTILSLLLVNLFTTPIKRLTNAANELSKGNFNITIENNSKDEIGVLANSFISIQEAVKGISQRLNQVNNMIIEGNLSERVDEKGFDGDFQEIAISLNLALETLITRYKETASYIDRISNGDIPRIITEEYKGDFNNIKNDINRCINAINNVLTDTNNLAISAGQGDISQRADANKHKGDFKNVIIGINKTLDRLVGLIDNMPIPVQIVDKDYQVLYLNNTAQKINE